VTSADFAEQAAAARVAAAKSAYRPTVSLNASVGYEGSVGSAPLLGLRAGQYYNAITAGATLTQPLFAGGLNASRVRAALENDNGQRIAVETARRQAVQSVSQAWNQILAARIGVEANERQVAADKIAFEGARQELKIGIRTTLDVLNAEQELQNAQLALVNAKHDLYVANAALLSAMGRLEIQYLAPDAARYNPEAQFKKVRRKGALPWDGVVAGLDALGAPSVRKAPAPGPQVTAAPLPPPPPAEAGSEVMN
jgi:outer membrane protein